MDLYSVFVTGANRGIGLEFVRQISRLNKPPRYIFATYRSASSLTALKEVKESSKESNVILIQMDVMNLEDIVSARKVVEQNLGENGLTLLINNAGVLNFLPFPEMTEEDLLTHFKINTVGPVRVFQELLPLLEKAAARGCDLQGMSVSRAAVINITSGVGSITRTGVGFTRDLALPGYKMSKAALNMAMRVIAANVKSKDILVVMMCPGWVKTDMGTDQGEITPEESISNMLQTFAKLNDGHHGTYIDRALKEVQESSKECKVVLIQMDVTNLEDIISARKVVEQTLEENGLTLLINNAGVAVMSEAFPEITEEGLLTQFKINTVGPVRIFQELLPLLEKAASRGNDLYGMSVSRAAVINISSMIGSIRRTGVEFIEDTCVPGYKMSKAALNMAMQVIADNVESKGILVVMMCPGWVKTDMGTSGPRPQTDTTNIDQITPEESISKMLQTFAKLNDAHHATYIDRKGTPYSF